MALTSDQNGEHTMAASFQLTENLNLSLISDNLAFEFPQPLTEKYRPLTIGAFVGLDKVKKIMSKLATSPFNSAWFFLGPSGTGKTTMALALTAEMPAEVHHIASKACDLDTVREIAKQCHYCPRMASDWTPC